jgi:hypothetical protein
MANATPRETFKHKPGPKSQHAFRKQRLPLRVGIFAGAVVPYVARKNPETQKHFEK